MADKPRRCALRQNPAPCLTILEELIDLLRIPSVSTGGGDAHALERAADWVCSASRRRRARRGWFDSTAGIRWWWASCARPSRTRQPSWSTATTTFSTPARSTSGTVPPFEPEERDGRLYARGAADDKGNFLPMLHVACELAREDELPVNVRFLVEGEEEVGSRSAMRWIREDRGDADCAVVFDSMMVDENTPAIATAARGLVAAVGGGAHRRA